MFDDNGNFYYSAPDTFSFSYDFTSLSSNSYIKEYFLSYLNKIQTLIIAPIDRIFQLLSFLVVIPENTELCYMGNVKLVKYQEYMTSTGSSLSSFTALDNYKVIK